MKFNAAERASQTGRKNSITSSIFSWFRMKSSNNHRLVQIRPQHVANETNRCHVSTISTGINNKPDLTWKCPAVSSSIIERNWHDSMRTHMTWNCSFWSLCVFGYWKLSFEWKAIQWFKWMTTIKFHRFISRKNTSSISNLKMSYRPLLIQFLPEQEQKICMNSWSITANQKQHIYVYFYTCFYENVCDFFANCK